MTQENLSLKEMCARYDVTPRTLRHYEYIELLFPEKVGRSRLYGPTERARLKLILRGRRFGFSLEEMRQWLLLYSEDRANRRQTDIWIEMSGRQIEELEVRKTELEETIHELQNLRRLSIEASKK